VRQRVALRARKSPITKRASPNRRIAGDRTKTVSVGHWSIVIIVRHAHGCLSRIEHSHQSPWRVFVAQLPKRTRKLQSTTLTVDRWRREFYIQLMTLRAIWGTTDLFPLAELGFGRQRHRSREGKHPVADKVAKITLKAVMHHFTLGWSLTIAGHSNVSISQRC